MKIMQFGDRLWAVYGIPDHPQRTLPVWFLFLLLVVFALYGQVNAICHLHMPTCDAGQRSLSHSGMLRAAWPAGHLFVVYGHLCVRCNQRRIRANVHVSVEAPRVAAIRPALAPVHRDK